MPRQKLDQVEFSNAQARIFIFEHARARSMLDFFILDATLGIVMLAKSWYDGIGSPILTTCPKVVILLSKVTNGKNENRD